jgi:transcriptional regulator of acetoin/glycerol metabolism
MNKKRRYFFEEVKVIVRTTKRIVKVSKESNIKRDTIYKKVKSVYRIVD